jgi:hypothetical protein
MNRYPPKTEEQKVALYGYFPLHVAEIGAAKFPQFMKDIQDIYGEQAWGVLGVIFFLQLFSFQITDDYSCWGRPSISGGNYR